jgi:hypothetical protein
MSRRHHGNRPPRLGPPRSADPARTRVDAPPGQPRPAAPERPAGAHLEPSPVVHLEPPTEGPPAPPTPAREPTGDAVAIDSRVPGNGPNGGPPPPAGCTAPQLRRFIKSRPYVPMHELRRRFGINGQEDDVCSIDLGERRVYVGLPAREGSLLGELLRGGDIGYELSLDPQTPIVVGLYPMRPVART